MIKLTLKQYNSIPTDYRNVWTNQEHPELVGKRTAFENSILGAADLPLTATPCTLIFEGIHFEISEIVLVKTHTRYYSKDDMDGGVNYWIYKSEGLSHLTNEEILDKLMIGTYTGGVGRFYKDHAYINRRKKYIIIDQTWGYDV